jgi:hypothetical protein
MSGDLPAPVVVPAGVRFQELTGEAVLLNLDNDRYYGLDDVGTRIWQLLAEHGDIETVMTKMLAEYEVDEATLRADLQTLVKELLEAGLLTAAD